MCLQEAAAEMASLAEEQATKAKSAPIEAAAARVKWRQEAAYTRQQTALSAAAEELERRKEREQALKQQVRFCCTVTATVWLFCIAL